MDIAARRLEVLGEFAELLLVTARDLHQRGLGAEDDAECARLADSLLNAEAETEGFLDADPQSQIAGLCEALNLPSPARGEGRAAPLRLTPTPGAFRFPREQPFA